MIDPKTSGRLAHCSRFALAVALAVPAVVAMPSVAYAQAEQQSFNIPAGDLAGALQAYSAQTGVQLVYSSELVAGKRSPGASGQLTSQAALGQLLAGSGLSARVSGNTATLVQAGTSGDVAAAEGERLLGPVRVEGSQGGSYQAPVRGDGIAQLGGIRGGQDGEADGFRALVSSVSTGTPVAIEEIPRSITVMTQKQLELQDVTSLNEALERMPGVTVTGGGVSPNRAKTQFYSRGYQIEAYSVDGGAPRALTSTNSTDAFLNTDAYERVELVRGPNALFAGESSLGGSLNLVRKRPGATEAIDIKAEVGNQDRRGLMLDYSTPSLFGSPIAFRVVASARRDGGYVENYDEKNYLLYGIFDAPLGDGARIEAGWNLTRLETNGAYLGVPRFVDGTLIPVPRDFNNGFKRTFVKSDGLELFAKLFVDIADDWDFEFGTSFRSDSYDQRVIFNSADFLPNGNPLYPGRITVSDYDTSKPTTIDFGAKLTGRITTFGLIHNLFLSANRSQNDGGPIPDAVSIYRADINSLDDFLEPNFERFEGTPLNYLYSGNSTTNQSIIIGDSITWRDIITIGAALRGDFSEASIGNYQLLRSGRIAAVGDSAVKSREWRPSFSATVRPHKNLTLFGSYADGFTRNDRLYSATGEAPDFVFRRLGPTTFQNLEVGARYATGKWIASLSAYRLKQHNLPVEDGRFICPPALDIFGGSGGFAGACYVEGDVSQTSTGLDFEASGEIRPGLSITTNANYSKLTTKGVDADVQKNFKTLAPTFSANVFVDWQPVFVTGLSLQAGARIKGRYTESGFGDIYDPDGNYVSTEPYTIKQSPFVVIDLGAEYAISNKLSAKLFVENITDKIYFTSVVQGVEGNFFGRPRSVMASLKWKTVGQTPADGRSPTNGLAPFGDPSDWYAAFDAGYAIVSDLHASADGKAVDGTTPVKWTFETKSSAAFSVRLGKYFGSNLRGEMEIQYRQAEFGKIGEDEGLSPFGVCGSRGSFESGAEFDCDDVDPGQTKGWSLLGNAIYEFGKRDATLRPFIGAGLGISRNTTGFQGKLRGIGLDTPWAQSTVRQRRELIVSEDRSAALVWQLIAGGSLKLNDRLRVDASYRLVTMPKLRWTSYNSPELTPTLGTFEAKYRSQFVSLGMRWAFGTVGN